MIKKISIIVSIMLVLFLLGCAKPAEKPVAAEKIAETPIAEIPADEIETGISDITTADEELDSSELDDLDTILEDIENI